MSKQNDECIWVRTEVWLKIGGGTPVKVQTRKLCRGGILLEYTGRITGQAVEVIFPDSGEADMESNSHYPGTITCRWPDGIWVGFNEALRSASELLMRNGLGSRKERPSLSLGQGR